MAIDNKTQRLQVTLSVSTVKMIDAILKEMNLSSRSAFLNEAAKQYAARLKRAHLNRALKAGYKERAERDALLLREWESTSYEVIRDEEKQHGDQTEADTDVS